MILGDPVVLRCRWHNFVDSMGVCAVCGLPGCETCLVLEADGYRCRKCAGKRAKPVGSPPIVPAAAPAGVAAAMPAQPTSIAVEPQPPPIPSASPRSAARDTKIILSMLIFLGFGSVLLVGQEIIREAIVQALWAGYIPWALFWGAPSIWRLWRKSPLGINLVGCLAGGWIYGAISLALLGLVIWGYSLLGGGAYQFAKHWWRLKHQSA